MDSYITGCGHWFGEEPNSWCFQWSHPPTHCCHYWFFTKKNVGVDFINLNYTLSSNHVSILSDFLRFFHAKFDSVCVCVCKLIGFQFSWVPVNIFCVGLFCFIFYLILMVLVYVSICRCRSLSKLLLERP